MSQTIRDILLNSRTIAVVGASTDPGKEAGRVPRYLKAAGYRVIPVNPGATEVLGEKAYPSLADVPGAVDVVEVFRPAAEAPDIAREAVRMGARVLWLQRGIVSEEARRIAQEAGLAYVEDRCMGTEVRKLAERASRGELDSVDALVDETSIESFPASDPPSFWAGAARR